MPGAVAKADRIVQPFARHVHPVVVGQQTQVHKRADLLKVAQPGQQPAHGKGPHGAHGQHLARAGIAQFFQGTLQVGERFGHHWQQRLPLVRQRQPTRQATKQGLAHAVFELSDVLADRSLRHVQLLGGPRQVEVARRGFERAQGIEREIHKFFWGLAASIVVGAWA